MISLVPSLYIPTRANTDENNEFVQNSAGSDECGNNDICGARCCLYCSDGQCCDSDPSGSACQTHNPRAHLAEMALGARKEEYFVTA